MKKNALQNVVKYLGLYVHIPFCEKKCDYCNFVSFCKPDSQKNEYVDAIKKEITIQGKNYKDYVVDTIFIGGGTPSCLQNGKVLEILSAIKNSFNVINGAEITIECNPNSITEQKLLEYKNAGVNRISIGLQAYNNILLKLIGRLHNKKQFNSAIKLCKKCNFNNINVDIILGIPNQKLFEVKKELRHIKKSGITHVSAYGLIVEENTKLVDNLKNNVYSLPSEELQVKMYDYTKKYLQKHGFFRYEVSNFAKTGYESKHNLKYWTNQEYLGLGLNASSYINLCRWRNTEVFNEYINKINQNVLPKEEIENIDINTEIEECIMLCLRTKYGINLNDFKQRFGFDILQNKKSEIDNLINSNLVEIKNNCLLCTDKGYKMLNQIILQLIDC